MNVPDAIQTTESDDAEGEEEEQDSLVEYESGFRMGTTVELSPRATDQSPETVMPSDTASRFETPRYEPSRTSAPGPLPARYPGQTEGESSDARQTAGTKRKRPDGDIHSSKKPRTPASRAGNGGAADQASMLPPPLPSRTPFRRAAYEGKKKTEEVLNFHQKGIRAVSRSWMEDSVPPGTFCDCNKVGCKHCDRRRRDQY